MTSELRWEDPQSKNIEYHVSQTQNFLFLEDHFNNKDIFNLGKGFKYQKYLINYLLDFLTIQQVHCSKEQA